MLFTIGKTIEKCFKHITNIEYQFKQNIKHNFFQFNNNLSFIIKKKKTVTSH